MGRGQLLNPIQQDPLWWVSGTAGRHLETEYFLESLKSLHSGTSVSHVCVRAELRTALVWWV